jgi:hypothetical protein
MTAPPAQRILDTPILRTTSAVIATLLRTDPHIMLTDELLNHVAWVADTPGVHLKASDAHTRGCNLWHPTPHCWCDWFLTIEGHDRSLVYRINSYDHRLNAWRASWPD